jgi:putative Mg2+ transporter-C (MgtC) family protein
MSLWQVFLRLLVALGCGAVIGLERERGDRPAGFRTTILVTMGASLFTALSLSAFEGSDPARVAAQVVVGIGFLGAGVIILYGGTVIRGITTAASLWASAAVGMAAGAGRFAVAGVSTALIFVTLSLFYLVEELLISRISSRQYYLKVRAEGKAEGTRELLRWLSEKGIKAEVIRLEACGAGGMDRYCVLRIKAHRMIEPSEMLNELMLMEGVTSVELEE